MILQSVSCMCNVTSGHLIILLEVVPRVLLSKLDMLLCNFGHVCFVPRRPDFLCSYSIWSGIYSLWETLGVSLTDSKVLLGKFVVALWKRIAVYATYELFSFCLSVILENCVLNFLVRISKIISERRKRFCTWTQEGGLHTNTYKISSPF